MLQQVRREQAKVDADVRLGRAQAKMRIRVDRLNWQTCRPN